MAGIGYEDHDDGKPGFFARWFYSTNHKDIGTLYLIFSIIACIIGTTFSVLMRIELSNIGDQFFGGNHQVVLVRNVLDGNDIAGFVGDV